MQFLFVDQITDFVPGEWIRGLKHVTADDFYLLPQPDGTWQFMPSLIGETLGQLAAWNVMLHHDFSLRPVAGVVEQAQIYRAVTVGETLQLQATIERLDEAAVLYSAVASVEEEVVFKVVNALGPLLPMDEFIDPQLAKAQYQEIYRPLSAETKAVSPMRPVERCPGLICASPGYDHMLEFNPGESMRMEKRISRQAPYFPDHFPRKPVLPMTMLLESSLAMAKIFLENSTFSETWQVARFQRMKMNEFVYPGDSLQTILNVKQYSPEALILSFRTEVRGKRVCVMEAVFENRE